AMRGAGGARGNAAAVASAGISFVQCGATVNSGDEGADQKPTQCSCNTVNAVLQGENVCGHRAAVNRTVRRVSSVWGCAHSTPALSACTQASPWEWTTTASGGRSVDTTH